MPITLLQPFNLDTTATYTVAQLTATGNVTGGNINVSGNIVDTGALSIVTGSNGNLNLSPNGTGIVTASGSFSASGNVSASNVVLGSTISGAQAALVITATQGSPIHIKNSVANSYTEIGIYNNSNTMVGAVGAANPSASVWANTAYFWSSNGLILNGNGAANITRNIFITTGGIVTVPGTTAASNTTTGAMTVSGGVGIGGNIYVGGVISATGRIFSASGTAGAPGITFSADTAQDTGFYWVSDGNIGVATNAGLRATFLDTGLSVVANVTGGNIVTGGLVTATSNVNTSAGVLATGNIRGGNLISAGTITTAGNIVSSAANAVANIGSATTYFNTVHAKATSAQYADVAEYYTSDRVYEPGTVVVFGGPAEVTMAVNPGDSAVAGVVSTNPAYIMNAGIQSECSVAVALTGRVPTKVIGPVNKGSMMVSAGNGHAQACVSPAMGTVIGKAIENFNGTTGIIEIVVGRL